MKKLLLIAALSMGAWTSFGQFTPIATSKSFKEPEAGFFKILKSDDGATIVVHDDYKNLVISKYDADKKLVYNKSVKIPFKANRKGVYSRVGNSNSLGYVTTIFTLKDELVFIASYLDGRVPRLKRITVDLNKGVLKQVSDLGELQKITMGSGYAMFFGGVPFPEFYVKKDPNSEYYTTIAFNSFSSDRSKRLHVTLYNGKNEEVASAYYTSPDDAYKYLELLDVFVDGNKGVYVLTSGMNTAASGGDREGGVFMGVLRPNSTTIELEQMPIKNGGNVDNAIMRYNPVMDKMVLMYCTAIRDKRKAGKMDVNLATFRKDLTDFHSQPVDYSELNQIAKTQFKRNAKVSGLPQALHINKDGSFALVIEDISLIEYTNTNSSSVKRSYYLEDLGVLKYNANAQFSGAQYIPKRQKTLYVPSAKFYSFREDIAFPLIQGTQYKSFSYINAPNQGYLLYNDIAKNQTKTQSGRQVTTIQGLKECEGYYFKGNDTGIPESSKLINSGKKDKNMFLFVGAHYDQNENEYIVLNRFVKKGKKGAEIVWLKVD